MARKTGYGQFCPVARAAEIVAERWTPLVLRELLSGSRRFGELRKGVPLMSPSLLSQRLRELEDEGVIERRPTGKGNSAEYHLTPAGEALRPLIEMLGLWGLRWIQRELRRDELDPTLLMWDLRRCVDPAPLPKDRRTVVQFELLGAPAKQRRWWLVFDQGDVDLCLKHPGYDVDLEIAAPLRDLIEVWLGTIPVRRALQDGTIALEGPREMVRLFPDWFGRSTFAKLAAAA